MLDDQLTFVKWIFLSKERLGIASVGWLAARVLDSVFRAKIEHPVLRNLIATALTLSASVCY